MSIDVAQDGTRAGRHLESDWCGTRSPGTLEPRACPPLGRDAGTVQAGAAPVDLARFPEAIQQFMVEAVPDPGLLPIAQTAPAGHAGTTAHLLRQQLPGDAALQHQDDAGRGGTIRNARLAPVGSGGSSGATITQRSSLTRGLLTPHVCHASSRF
jgi:hypothetical protein